MVRKKPSWHTEGSSLSGVEPLDGEWMTPRRRFLSAVAGGRVDKVLSLIHI